MCARECPYQAIIHRERPCKKSCPVGAIHYDENGFCVIDEDKCVQCGHCIHNCPFGAIGSKTFLVQVINAIKEGKEVIGNKTKIKIVKNKVAPPFRSTIVEVLYGEGISRLGEVLDFAVARDLIKKSGSFYSYNGERIGQGRENAKAWLIANPEAVEELEAKIREEMLSNPAPLAEVQETESSSEDDDDNEEFEIDAPSTSTDEEVSSSTTDVQLSSSGQENRSYQDFVDAVDRGATVS